MKRCKHRHTHHRRWIGEWETKTSAGFNCYPGWVVPADSAVVCQDCGAWLPLGPSNDAGCEAEILAAFLVNPGGFVSLAHKDYHDREWVDDWCNYEFREDCTACQAEYLTDAIVTHDAG